MNRYLIFDESGNLGSKGRFFVIACIDTDNYKPLNNVMKRKLGTAKKLFIELASLHAHEIKAKDAYPCIKYHPRSLHLKTLRYHILLQIFSISGRLFWSRRTYFITIL